MTKDSTVLDGRESLLPIGCKAKVVLWRGCLGETWAEGHSLPGLTQLGGYQVFGCLLLWNNNHILCSQFCGSLVLAGPGSSTGVVWTAGDVWDSPTGVIYIWGLGKAVGWLLRFFTSYLLGLQCPPRRCLHSHICLRRLEQLGDGQHCSLHALFICIFPAGKSQGGWPLTYKTAQNPKSECSKKVKQWGL